MSNVQAFHEVVLKPTYKSDYARAKAQGTCIMCGRLAIRFREPSAKFEYTVSALCQQCQDQLFSSRQRGKQEEEENGVPAGAN